MQLLSGRANSALHDIVGVDAGNTDDDDDASDDNAADNDDDTDDPVGADCLFAS
jgi:hypothetical protein